MSIRMRSTKSATKNRRSHHALVGIRAIPTENGGLALSHRLDETTGMYRGKQIVPAKVVRVKGEAKVKGPRTEAAHDEHKHEKGEHQHENAEKKPARGFFGRVANALPKARRGAGGGGA